MRTLRAVFVATVIAVALGFGLANASSFPPGGGFSAASLDTISSTRGALLERGSGGWTAITPGTSGQLFVSNGSGADPSWQSVFPKVVAFGRLTGQTAAAGTVVSRAVGASDATFMVSHNLRCTTATSYSFNVAVAYTDEGGNGRSQKLINLDGANLLPDITNANLSNRPGQGMPIVIRCQASSTITVSTSGTFTTVTYNVEGTIEQLQ